MVCVYSESGKNIFLTHYLLMQFAGWRIRIFSRITKFADGNSLLTIPRNVAVKEHSVLNGGFLFDLELPLAWKGLTGQDVPIWIIMGV